MPPHVKKENAEILLINQARTRSYYIKKLHKISLN